MVILLYEEHGEIEMEEQFSHENLHMRDELMLAGHDKLSASPWIV